MPRLVCTILLVAFLVGCRSGEEAASVPPPEAQRPALPEFEGEERPEPEDIVSAVGTVQYVDLEGGFYGIVVEDTVRYNPMNLPESYREDGLRVRFRAQLRDDVMTAQMWGRPIEVLDIMRLE